MTTRAAIRKVCSFSLLAVPALLLALVAVAAAAQTAPVPRSMPRIPVNQQVLYNHTTAQTHEIQGTATIIDGEKLRIGDNDLRLFGIVPPQLSANYGPQARGVLDTLSSGQTLLCQVRDRDREGRLLVTCHNGNGNDLALELLKRGLAVTARGSIANTDLANVYINAEQTAQAQKLGLWSVNTPSSTSAAATPMQTESAPGPSEIAKAESLIAAIPTPAFLKDKPDDNKVAEKTGDALAVATEKAVKPAPIPQVSNRAILPPPPGSSEIDNDVPASVSGVKPGFIERYQLLLTGFVMLATALTILTILTVRQRIERRDEIRAIAAALRGELMAARSVCQSRARAITSEAEDKVAAWPRLRVTLYNAYVGRIGFLGAELARQIASIYGQASDYASYYNTDLDRNDSAPKRQALQNLVSYIDEVTPRLALIEQSGQIPTNYAASNSSYGPPSSGSLTVSSSTPSSAVYSPSSISASNQAALAAPRTSTFASTSSSLTPPASPSPNPTTSTSVSSTTSASPRALGTTPRTPPASSLATASLANQVAAAPTAPPEAPATLRKRVDARRASMPKPAAPQQAEDTPSAAYMAAMQAPIHLWEAVRNFAREHLAERSQAADDGIGEYSRLMEDDLAAYSYDDPDDDMAHHGYTGKLRETGS